MNSPPPFFWLHIKKSAGTSLREMLQPYYYKSDLVKRPKCFLQSSPDEWNDILNNHLTLLGEYQFKRALFAREYLYKAKWSDIYSFAICREPTERCISMFHYLFWNKSGLKARALQMVFFSRLANRVAWNKSSAFDIFLDVVELSRQSDTNLRPFDLHFNTHTRTMWEDVTDHNGEMLLSKIYKMVDLPSIVGDVFIQSNIKEWHQAPSKELVLNKSVHKQNIIKLHAKQVARIEQLFKPDFELYSSL